MNKKGTERIRAQRENGGDDQVCLLFDQLEQEFQTIKGMIQRIDAFPPSSLLDEGDLRKLREYQRENTSRQERCWIRHTYFHDGRKRDSPKHYKEILRYSWIIVCQRHVIGLFLKDMIDSGRGHEKWPEVLTKTAMDFDVVNDLCEHERAIHVSMGQIGTYTIKLLMNALALLADALDAHGWTASAGAYLDTLFALYAFFITVPEVIDDSPTALKDFLHEDQDETTPEILILHPKRVSNLFVDLGEHLFFNHIWHNRAVADMVKNIRPSSDAATRQRKNWLETTGLAAFERILVTSATTSTLSDTIVNEMKLFYPQRLILPGEHEQIHFSPFQNQPPGPYDVLLASRVDHFRRAQEVVAFKDKYSIKTVLQSVVKRTKNGEEEKKDIDYERIVLLLFEIAFKQSCQLWEVTNPYTLFEKHAYCDLRMADMKIQARNRPPLTWDTVVRQVRESHFPFFGVIWSVHFVQHADLNVPPLITTSLVEALTYWLGCIYERKETLLPTKSFWYSGWDKLALPAVLLRNEDNTDQTEGH